jgi:ribosomal protein S11
MPPKSRTAAGAKKVRRKEKKNVAQGEAHIKSTFNNTIVTIEYSVRSTQSISIEWNDDLCDL